ncbi:flagellar brake protein [Blastococcus sp. SYSU D00695]
MDSRTVDLPQTRDMVDLQVDGIPEGLVATVLEAAQGTLLVTVGRTGAGRAMRLDPDTGMQVTWRDGSRWFGVPARYVATHAAAAGEAEPRWELLLVGAAKETQRRNAVRVPLRLGVTVNAGREDRAGSTLDLSEGGARLLLHTAPTDRDGGIPHTSGDALRLRLDLDGTVVEDEVRIVRRFLREDGQWEVSVRFTGLTEKQQDEIRRRVFTEMRLLRSRGSL